MKNKRKGDGYVVVKIKIPGQLHALAKSESALEQVEVREYYQKALEKYIGITARKRATA
jgi:hypothetical protein